MPTNELKKRSKKWQLTENNPDYTKQEAVERLCSIGEAIYCVSCSETGESGTKHVHAFVVFKNAILGDSLKKHFARAHIEACKGSIQSNYDYIVKDDPEPYEVGERPLIAYDSPQNVASEVVCLMGQGRTPLDILRTEPGCADYVVKHFHSLNEIYTALVRERKRR